MIYHRYGAGLKADATIEQGFSTAVAIPQVSIDFTTQAETFGWSQKIFSLSPFALYWIARHVIHDHWPAAENVIKSDEETKRHYDSYVANLKNCGILNSTMIENGEFVVNEFDIIVGVHPDRLIRRKRLEDNIKYSNDSDALINRIADEMAVFRKKRKLKVLEPIDDED